MAAWPGPCSLLSALLLLRYCAALKQKKASRTTNKISPQRALNDPYADAFPAGSDDPFRKIAYEDDHDELAALLALCDDFDRHAYSYNIDDDPYWPYATPDDHITIRIRNLIRDLEQLEAQDRAEKFRTARPAGKDDSEAAAHNSAGHIRAAGDPHALQADTTRLAHFDKGTGHIHATPSDDKGAGHMRAAPPFTYGTESSAAQHADESTAHCLAAHLDGGVEQLPAQNDANESTRHHHAAQADCGAEASRSMVSPDHIHQADGKASQIRTALADEGTGTLSQGKHNNNNDGGAEEFQLAPAAVGAGEVRPTTADDEGTVHIYMAQADDREEKYRADDESPEHAYQAHSGAEQLIATIPEAEIPLADDGAGRHLDEMRANDGGADQLRAPLATDANGHVGAALAAGGEGERRAPSADGEGARHIYAAHAEGGVELPRAAQADDGHNRAAQAVSAAHADESVVPIQADLTADRAGDFRAPYANEADGHIHMAPADGSKEQVRPAQAEVGDEHIHAIQLDCGAGVNCAAPADDGVGHVHTVQSDGGVEAVRAPPADVDVVHMHTVHADGEGGVEPGRAPQADDNSRHTLQANGVGLVQVRASQADGDVGQMHTVQAEGVSLEQVRVPRLDDHLGHVHTVQADGSGGVEPERAPQADDDLRCMHALQAEGGAEEIRSALPHDGVKSIHTAQAEGGAEEIRGALPDDGVKSIHTAQADGGIEHVRVVQDDDLAGHTHAIREDVGMGQLQGAQAVDGAEHNRATEADSGVGEIRTAHVEYGAGHIHIAQADGGMAKVRAAQADDDAEHTDATIQIDNVAGKTRAARAEDSAVHIPTAPADGGEEHIPAAEVDDGVKQSRTGYAEDGVEHILVAQADDGVRHSHAAQGNDIAGESRAAQANHDAAHVHATEAESARQVRGALADDRVEQVRWPEHFIRRLDPAPADSAEEDQIAQSQDCAAHAHAAATEGVIEQGRAADAENGAVDTHAALRDGGAGDIRAAQADNGNCQVLASETGPLLEEPPATVVPSTPLANEALLEPAAAFAANSGLSDEDGKSVKVVTHVGDEAHGHAVAEPVVQDEQRHVDEVRRGAVAVRNSSESPVGVESQPVGGTEFSTAVEPAVLNATCDEASQHSS